ncbi:SNF2 family N-terminal domain-containing protein [Xylogone sp. PMI_703]|nr:SNF2 family N-terminal domain-containing protein [Xylogone sp. PMI_703]
MDPHHHLHHAGTKRRRLEGAENICAKPSTESHARFILPSLSQGAYGYYPSQYVGQPNYHDSSHGGRAETSCLSTTGSGFHPLIFNSYSQPDYLPFGPHDALIQAEGPNSFETASPWVAMTSVPSSASWFPRGDSSQLPPAHQSTFIPVLDHPYTAASFLPPVFPQQSDEMSSIIASQYSEAEARPSDLPSVSQPDDVDSEIVCFGMISCVSGRYEKRCSNEMSSPFEVQLDSSDSFSVKDGPPIHGRIQSEYGHMIEGLIKEETLKLHVSCILDGKAAVRKSSHRTGQLPCVLEITVYGPLELFEEIGDWFQEYEVYLQDPKICHLDVRYCNPQKLSSDDLDSCPLLSEIITQISISSLQDITQGPGLLDILSSDVYLGETPQPKAIQTALKSHQKQALTFMLRRENGWSFDGSQRDLWEKVDTGQGRFFVNTITNAHQTDEPPQFYGGIIADPMGLGKTLTMIALTATDLDHDSYSEMHIDIDQENNHNVSATLIIIPPPLLGTWEEQLSEHVIDKSLRYCRHHSKTRLVNADELNGVNIVLSTYHTVSAEWKGGRGIRSSVLFSVRWRRVILDEAHYIRSGNSRMAHAICDLDSKSRWAVTGTPIQNRLSDLSTLLRFIRVYPYTDPKCFDADISRLWKSGEDEKAAERLQRLSAYLLLRRPKTTINLPPRRDTRLPVDFNAQEKAFYEEIREKAITRIDEALQNNSETSRAGVYVNVLQQIESLRLVCNLGLHYRARHSKTIDLSTEAIQQDWSSIAQHTFNVQRGMGPIICVQCSSLLELTDTVDDTTAMYQNPQFSRCLKFTCGECIQKSSRTSYTVTCNHRSPCPTATVSISTTILEDIPDLDPPPSQTRMPSISLPSKVEALVADLKSLPSDVKCIVFSTWRLTLDIIQAGLDQASLSSIRFDGKVPQRDRQSVVDKFKKDSAIRVMLLTLSCGAVGLTLTEASRAYLMEPHWNPTLEEQALARIHRIGQTREVTTVRFYVRDSFEEQVMEIQESKKNLAGVLLSPHDGESTNDNLGMLQKLRSLL